MQQPTRQLPCTAAHNHSSSHIQQLTYTAAHISSHSSPHGELRSPEQTPRPRYELQFTANHVSTEIRSKPQNTQSRQFRSTRGLQFAAAHGPTENPMRPTHYSSRVGSNSQRLEWSARSVLLTNHLTQKLTQYSSRNTAHAIQPTQCSSRNTAVC
jgi:hypothetical protein